MGVFMGDQHRTGAYRVGPDKVENPDHQEIVPMSLHLTEPSYNG